MPASYAHYRFGKMLLKELPADLWAKDHNSVPFLGLMASEGGQREMGLVKNGCNYYGKETACARLVIDTNGFEKSPNRMSTSKDYKRRQTDQFELWMFHNIFRIAIFSHFYFCKYIISGIGKSRKQTK